MSTARSPASSGPTSKKMSSSFDAFAAVDEIVSKPVLGSDGAASWQQFRNEIRILDSHVSTAPKAPLKKADKLGTGLTTWEEEQKYEAQLRQEAGAVVVDYVHFRQKNTAEEAAKRKEMKRIENRIRPNEKEYFLKAETFQGYKFDYVFTTRDWGTGYYWDGTDSLKQLRNGELSVNTEGNDDDNDDDDDDNNKDAIQKRGRDKVETVSQGKEKKKRKRKRANGENDGPVFVNDPNNPLEQVANALQRRAQQQQQQQQQLQIFSPTPTLPSGWETATDPSTGKMYYFCRATGQRQWEPPSAYISAMTVTTNNNQDTSSKPTAETTTALPDGWNVAKDPNTGKEYYFHTDGQTSWERPKA